MSIKSVENSGRKSADLAIRLIGKDSEKLEQAAKNLANAVHNYSGTYNVAIDNQPGKSQIVFTLNNEAHYLGLTPKYVGD
jgi:Cu/Ag efflux pump CusA